jgi:NAD(P)-dependent dehydrogenase (short-subunit alcohol dehydrogenase family)
MRAWAAAGAFVTGSREQLERTFAIDWWGVYNCARAFLPLLIASEEGVLVNTSSVNGFWASIGPGVPQTAYSAAKFAVKGFTEALITDLRTNAPHIKCSVVMPGHIGTSIVSNSRKIQFGTSSEAMSPEEIAQARARLSAAGRDVSQMSDADIQKSAAERARRFLEEAPMTAAAATAVILEGVKADRWRILVGNDAHQIDERVRRTPEDAYEDTFFDDFARDVGWRVGR